VLVCFGSDAGGRSNCMRLGLTTVCTHLEDTQTGVEVIQASNGAEAWMSERLTGCLMLKWVEEIEPLMPRGRRGAHRVEDRRVISGIAHMLRSGVRRHDCPAADGPVQPLQPEPAGDPVRDFPRPLTGSTGLVGAVAIDSRWSRAHRSEAG
jgi:hypothetical protein